MGFAEVQYDYVRFPDEPESKLASALFPGRRAGETKRQGVTRNLRLLRDRTRPLGVPFTIDVFGLTTSARGDMGIGQYWEDLVTTADVVLPMVYPSHYMRGVYNLKHPNSEPYQVIRRAMQDALRRSAPLGETAEIRPYLQAFTLGQPRYTPGDGPGADPRRRGAGPRLLGALESAERLRRRRLPPEARRRRRPAARCDRPSRRTN